MRNVESYKPDKKVASTKTRDLVLSKKHSKQQKNTFFNIKNDPKVITKAIFYSATSICLLMLIVFSSYKIIRWQAETDVTNELIATLQATTTVSELQVNNIDAQKNTEHTTKNDSDKNDILNDKNILITADIPTLKSTNQDTIGWIYVSGTNINYPFVQTTDNSFYLTHSFNRAWNTAGWVFLDYRNNKNLDDKNQIIYAHGRVDGSMFGTLANVLKDTWQNNPENYYVKIATETSSSLWQVFSTYQIANTNDYILTNFNNDNHFKNFIDLIKNRSNFNYNINVSEDDKILTLSTCVGTNDRAVLHAKLIKQVLRQQ